MFSGRLRREREAQKAKLPKNPLKQKPVDIEPIQPKEKKEK
jgi:hypothetical protein